MKSVETIQLEGTFKIRKIFTSRSQIPADNVIVSADNPFAMATNAFSAAGRNATATSVGLLRQEDVISALGGQRIEVIPKNFDFGTQVSRVNQVISFESVNGHV